MSSLVEVNVKRTGCKKTVIVGDVGEIIDLNVKGKPENGEANLEIIKFFSRRHKCPVRIIRGLRSKNKLIKLLP